MPQSSIASWLTRAVASGRTPQEQSDAVHFVEERRPKTPAEQLRVGNVDNVSGSCAIQATSSAPVIQSAPYSNLKPKPLPPNVAVELCDKARLVAFQRLTSLLLPIPYSKQFYAETISDPVISSLTRLAIWHGASDTSTQRNVSEPSPGRVVGAIRCRLLQGTPPTLYISTIGVLAPFRELGLATHLLLAVTQSAVREYGIKEVVAHVWEANQEGLAWYQKRGFEVVGKEADYYMRLKPRTAAFVVSWEIGVTDLLGWGDS